MEALSFTSAVVIERPSREHLSRVPLQQAGDDRDRRHLPGPIRLEETVRLAGPYLEPHVVDGDELAERLP